MLKAALKGEIKLALDFLRTISEFDNFFILTWFFIKYKIFKVKPVFK